MSVISMEMIWTVPVTLLSSGQDMKERYESLAATRADLVQNAVNLQQLLVKLKQSEVRDAAQTDRNIVCASVRCIYIVSFVSL